MKRCITLAKRGASAVTPNPMVGSILVHEDRIIGEGWHQQWGGPHAEPNCIADAISKGLEQLLNKSTLYVSLEPCAHHGKTPPCTDLIIHHKIPKLVIGCRDTSSRVNGKGIEKLREAGLEVKEGVLERECRELNKRYFSLLEKKRPYIILKWAQTQDGVIGKKGKERILISNSYSNKQVHQWRSEEASILVGTNTAMLDDPELSTRDWPGASPIRLVIDKELRLSSSLRIFNNAAPTIIFNSQKEDIPPGIEYSSMKKAVPRVYYFQIKEWDRLPAGLINALYSLNIQSVLVEGGAQLLQSFINEELWDECRVITNQSLAVTNPGKLATIGISKTPVDNTGVKRQPLYELIEDPEFIQAPTLKNYHPIQNNLLGNDRITIYKKDDYQT